MIVRRTFSQQGFSAIELIVVMSIFAILIAVVGPKYSDLSGSSSRFSARSHLLEDIKTAQAYTLTQGCRGIFTIDADAQGYTFGCDFLGYDTNDPPAPDSIELTRRFDGNITIAASATIILNSRGQTVDKDDIQQNVTLTLAEDGSTFAEGDLLGTGVFEYD